HYLVVVALGTMLKEYTCLAPGAIYAVLTVAVLLLSPAIYELIKRIPLVSWCVLGIHNGEKGPILVRK
ncbi:MAG: hypothetical protein KBT00_03480, partial [Bacteroidales bacterium]|nr:hypothetical protein [Candidatus Cacconaster merdequi]